MSDPKPRANPERDRRRRVFLRALASGRSVVTAADTADIAWSTLYAWRRDEPKFRAAWDRAAGFGSEALFDRVQSALIQRAVDGIDEPVFHAGKIVGTRKRYSDTLLVTMMREQIIYRPEDPESETPPPEADEALEWLGDDDDDDDALETTTVLAPPTPLPALSTESAAPEPAVCLAHLNRAEPEGPS